MKKRYYIVMATLLLGVSVAKSQDHIKLDLQKTIQLANDSSLEAFRTQNMYLSGYWEYRTYKANRLPSLTLNMTPAEYNRDITKRYDSENDLDVYRSQQSFYASGNLAIQQNFDLTGGTFYLQSQLGYMRSFGGSKSTQFTSLRHCQVKEIGSSLHGYSLHIIYKLLLYFLVFKGFYFSFPLERIISYQTL